MKGIENEGANGIYEKCGCDLLQVIIFSTNCIFDEALKCNQNN